MFMGSFSFRFTDAQPSPAGSSRSSIPRKRDGEVFGKTRDISGEAAYITSGVIIIVRASLGNVINASRLHRPAVFRIK